MAEREDISEVLSMVCSVSEIDPKEQRAETFLACKSLFKSDTIKMLHQLKALLLILSAAQ